MKNYSNCYPTRTNAITQLNTHVNISCIFPEIFDSRNEKWTKKKKNSATYWQTANGWILPFPLFHLYWEKFTNKKKYSRKIVKKRMRKIHSTQPSIKRTWRHGKAVINFSLQVLTKCLFIHLVPHVISPLFQGNFIIKNKTKKQKSESEREREREREREGREREEWEMGLRSK